jgi:RNA polymerase sigma-70 factor (ECF subfamily)
MGPHDADWLAAAVRKYEGQLRLYSTRLLGSPDRAEDVVQEAFLRLCKADRTAVEPQLAAWLFTVCRNLAFDLLRKEKRMTAPVTRDDRSSSGADPSSAAEVRDAFQRVSIELAGLPNQQQEVVRLKFQHGLSYREISEVTGLTVPTVGFTLHTALTALRRTFATAASLS